MRLVPLVALARDKLAASPSRNRIANGVPLLPQVRSHSARIQFEEAMTHGLRSLQDYLRNLAAGPIVDPSEVEALLGGSWNSLTVRVQIAVVIPDDGPKQTTAERRKRFRAALGERLNAVGWQSLKPNS